MLGAVLQRICEVPLLPLFFCGAFLAGVNAFAGDAGANLMTYVNERAPASIADMSKYFEEQGLGDYWTIVFESRSQRAKIFSPENPRILLFSSLERPTLGMAFGACPGEEASATAYPETEALEFYTFSQERSAFEFREVRFPGKGAPPGTRPILTAANPSKCLECHGADPRPLIDAYNTWDGWVGSLSRGTQLHIRKGSPEWLATQKAYNAIRGNSSLNFLKWHSNKEVESRAPDSVLTQHSAVWDVQADLTEGISDLNVERLKRILIGPPEQYRSLKYALYALTDPAVSYSQFLTLLPGFTPKLQFPQIAKIREIQHQSVSKRIAKLNPVLDDVHGPQPSVFGSDEYIQEADLLLAKLVSYSEAIGQNPKQLSTSFVQQFNFQTPRGQHYPLVMLPQQLQQELEKDPEIQSVLRTKGRKIVMDLERAKTLTLRDRSSGVHSCSGAIRAELETLVGQHH